MYSRVLITGASGFVGAALVQRLAGEAAFSVRAVGRRDVAGFPEGVEVVRAGDLAPGTDWSAVLCGCDAVVHLAARVHVMRDEAANPLAEFRRVNTVGTLHLARQAAQAGVRRFVYLSSIKVNGEETMGAAAFNADDVPNPQDAYAVSKFEAEQGLLALAHETGMEVVIIRPPLVYGPGVKGNFLAMMRWLARGVPLPLGAVTGNRRSLVGLDNLVDLVMTCLTHSAAANQVFLAGDGEDLSTAELLRRLAVALGAPARLFPVPVWLLDGAAALLGRRAAARRLCGSLQVDIGKARALLGWEPPVPVDEGLRRVAEAFLK